MCKPAIIHQTLLNMIKPCENTSWFLSLILVKGGAMNFPMGDHSSEERVLDLPTGRLACSGEGAIAPLAII